MRAAAQTIVALGAVITFGIAGCSSGGGGDSSQVLAAEAGPISMRRLTGEQYTRSIHDVLGDHITVPGRIDPDDRREGLLAVGSTFVSVSASGFEKYEAAATVIAEQALDGAHRATLVPCEPASTSGSSEVCAREFVQVIGHRLFRRPLTDAELGLRVSIANDSADELSDFYAGLQLSLASLLISPHFLFQIETAEPDPANPSRFRLTGGSLASRMSYLLLNTTPDDELLDAAENGSLVETEGLSAQVDRLIESSGIDIGLRAFFSDLYEFKQFDDGIVRKDSQLFPAYSQAVADDAKEQTLLTIATHLTAGGDARDLFTTRDTFLSRTLGLVYQVLVTEEEGFEARTFEDSSPRAGILSHISLMALYSHPGRASATLRGKFVREVLLCQDVPTPPANVDFTIDEETLGQIRTARERLEAHVGNEACAGCHTLMDPIGLAFENFDAIGAFRVQENGATIDASGEIDGVRFEDAIGLGQALRDHPALGPCLVKSIFRYAVGREPTLNEEPFLESLQARFASSGYEVPNLLRELVMSEGFRTTSGPRDAAEGGVQ